YTIYKMDKDTFALILSEYLHQVHIGNFDRSLLLIPKLLYSNQNFKHIDGISEDGILLPEQIDHTLPASPLSEAKLRTAKNTAEGQRIRYVANNYQALWAQWAKDSYQHSSTSNHEKNIMFLTGL